MFKRNQRNVKLWRRCKACEFLEKDTRRMGLMRDVKCMGLKSDVVRSESTVRCSESEF